MRYNIRIKDKYFSCILPVYLGCLFLWIKFFITCKIKNISTKKGKKSCMVETDTTTEYASPSPCKEPRTHPSSPKKKTSHLYINHNLIRRWNKLEHESKEGTNFHILYEKEGRWSRIYHPLTAICLLCLSIHGMSCNLILPTASYHRESAGSTPEGGHWLFPPSASGARMFESILHRAW